MTPTSATAVSGILAVDKPAGLHTAPLRAGETGTLLGLVIERYPEVAALHQARRVVSAKPTGVR